MKNELDEAVKRFGVQDRLITELPEHDGGRNRIFVLEKQNGEKTVLRLSSLCDRTEEDYLAETEFVRYLAENGGPVADVIPSVNGKTVERIANGAKTVFASLFQYAPGMLIAENGYRYRKGIPISEYFFNTGKALGKIHALSKSYRAVHRRADYFDKYNPDYIGTLIPESFAELKRAIFRRLEEFKKLPIGADFYGLVHFDFSDGNYHVDMKNGNITVFDFDNSMYCWYLFDLANLWIHGVGWCMGESNSEKRRAFMKNYFNTVLDGYRSETDLSEELMEKIPLFIDMALIENIVDEFECCNREGVTVEDEDVADAASVLIHDRPWAGIFDEV